MFSQSSQVGGGVSQYFAIHPTHPQSRLIDRACKIIQEGGVVVYPTDSAYAIGCKIGEADALAQIRHIRQLPDDHLFTLMCRDLSEISTYAVVNNQAFRLLKAHTPGPYTFILPATREVPRRLQHPKRKTIGLRVPEHPITLALLATLDEPLLSASLILPDQEWAMSDPEEIREVLERQVDLIIDGGHCIPESTTVVDLVTDVPTIVRVGRGDPSLLELS